MKKIVTLLLLLASSLAFATDEIWIDVRAPAEFAQGHLAGAILIPHQQIAEKIGDLKLAKEMPIHLYCKSGRRAEVAKQALHELRFSKVTNHGSLAEAKAFVSKTTEP